MENEDQNDENLDLEPSISKNVEEKKRFSLKKWTGVTMWAWDIAVDNCAICRNHIMEVCLDCQAEHTDQINTEEVCSIAWGICKHAFHLHCISRWVKTRNVCPLDNTEWEYQRS